MNICTRCGSHDVDFVTSKQSITDYKREVKELKLCKECLHFMLNKMFLATPWFDQWRDSAIKYRRKLDAQEILAGQITLPI